MSNTEPTTDFEENDKNKINKLGSETMCPRRVGSSCFL
jgi:hypothetical protein